MRMAEGTTATDTASNSTIGLPLSLVAVFDMPEDQEMAEGSLFRNPLAYQSFTLLLSMTRQQQVV